ncbi:MAG: hypothetical protein ACLUI3_10065 [Christensenellales bacterium]
MTEGGRRASPAVKGKPALHYARGMRWVSATIADECGAVRCMWFNQPWMKERLFDTCEVTLYGRCVRKRAGCLSSTRRWKNRAASFRCMPPCRAWGAAARRGEAAAG